MTISPEGLVERPTYTLPKEKPPSMWFLNKEQYKYFCRFRPGDVAGFLAGKIDIATMRATLRHDEIDRYNYGMPCSGLYPPE